MSLPGTDAPSWRRTLFVVSAALPLSACQGLLDPKGPIARAEMTMLGDATIVMLAVIMPVILMTIGFAWWFRSGNRQAKRLPDWEYSGKIEIIIWWIPALVIMFLGGMAWIGSHEVDPARPIPSNVRPLKVQVVSLDWKWLFIYPDQGIATVNELVIPEKTPIEFSLTSISVMNSFFVPQLGSQIYTMAGMRTRLHLLADHAGEYKGMSAQFSGDGFSDMRFVTTVTTAREFTDWVTDTRQRGGTLDSASFKTLALPSHKVPPGTWSAVTPGLFDTIVMSSVPAQHDAPSHHLTHPEK